jgi:DNA-binding LytR/AlgR family response regulator
MKARAILVEDETQLRHHLEELLEAVWPDLQIVASAADGAQALVEVERHRPDILFLDVEMPEMSGIEVARRANGRAHVVFVTAYSQYAVAAFEAGAVDYLLKPIDAQRLATACARLQARLGSAPPALDQVLAQLAARIAPPRSHLRWVTASSGSTVRLITVDEILYFQSDTKYTRVVTAAAEALIQTPLKELLEQLDPEEFWQIHRGTIVRATAIDSVARDGLGHALVRLKGRDEALKVSQPYMYRFRQM